MPKNKTLPKDTITPFEQRSFCRRRLYRFFAVLCSACCLLSLAACARPVEPTQTLSYGELLGMMNQSVQNDFADVIVGNLWWGAQDGRLWTCGQVAGEYDDPLARPLCVASSAPDGSGMTSMALPLPFDEELQRRLRQLAEQNPACTYTGRQSPDQIFFFRGATLRKDTALPFAFAKPLFEEQTTEASTAAVICGFHDMRQFDLTTGQARTLLKWENYQVDFSAVSAVFLLEEEDQYLVIDRDNSFHLLTVVDDMLLDDDIITFAVTGSGYTKQLQAAVDAYNATQPEKFVTILDYTIEAATERGFSGSEEMLQRAILDDEVPDIVMTPSGMNSQNLIRQGFFADLYPLLDADPELQRADFLENVLACCEYQDTLPTIIPAFSIFTAVGSSDLVGETPGWNWQEYDALCAAYPDATPFYGLGRNDILLYLLQMGGDRFIDYEKGEAHLDGEAFVTLLEASAAYPAAAGDLAADPAAADALAADPKPALTSRQALLQVGFLFEWRALLTQEYASDGPVTLKGFPSDDGGQRQRPDPRAAAWHHPTLQRPAGGVGFSAHPVAAGVFAEPAAQFPAAAGPAGRGGRGCAAAGRGSRRPLLSAGGRADRQPAPEFYPRPDGG